VQPVDVPTPDPLPDEDPRARDLAGGARGRVAEAGGAQVLERWILFVPALASLAPFVACRGLFERMFWFGDDIDQVNLIDRLGFWRWMWTFYGENFVPLFKLMWGGCMFLFDGSYGAMIALVWLNHALNVFLLGRVMRTCGLSWAAVLLAQVVFGLAPSTTETLAFSIEWSVVLSLTFMLLALDNVLRPRFRPVTIAWVAASVLTFVKGVLTGPVLACITLWPERGVSTERPLRRLAHAALYLLPSVAMGLLIALEAEGNHRHMAGHGAEAALYGLWYYCFNPALILFYIGSRGWRTLLLLGLAKTGLIAWALRHSSGKPRAFFASLVLFDIANAVLLGIGRYNAGLPTAVSSRYQYASLIAILPLAGFALSRAWDRVPLPSLARRGALAALLLSIGVVCCRLWNEEMSSWSVWRGSEVHRVLVEDPFPSRNAVPGYPGFPMDRARELIRKYHLH